MLYFCRIIQNWYWPLNHLVYWVCYAHCPHCPSPTMVGQITATTLCPQVVTWCEGRLQKKGQPGMAASCSIHSCTGTGPMLWWITSLGLHKEPRTPWLCQSCMSFQQSFNSPCHRGMIWNVSLSLQLAKFQEFGIVLAMFRLGWFISHNVLWEDIRHWRDVAHVCLFLQ